MGRHLAALDLVSNNGEKSGEASSQQQLSRIAVPVQSCNLVVVSSVVLLNNLPVKVRIKFNVSSHV